MMYLGFINKVVSSQLNESFGNDWMKKNIGYLIPIENMLLDDLDAPKEDIQQLLFVGSILRKQQNREKRALLHKGKLFYKYLRLLV
jgi:hypothetical protein